MKSQKNQTKKKSIKPKCQTGNIKILITVY